MTVSFNSINSVPIWLTKNIDSHCPTHMPKPFKETPVHLGEVYIDISSFLLTNNDHPKLLMWKTPIINFSYGFVDTGAIYVAFYNEVTQMTRFMRPTWGPPGDDRAPCWPRELCYQGWIRDMISTNKLSLKWRSISPLTSCASINLLWTSMSASRNFIACCVLLHNWLMVETSLRTTWDTMHDVQEIGGDKTTSRHVIPWLAG